MRRFINQAVFAALGLTLCSGVALAEKWDMPMANALDEDTRNIVKGMAMLAERAGSAKAQQLADWYLTQLAANGMKVQPAGAQLKQDLQSIGKTMSAEWSKKAGAKGKTIIDAYSGM